MSDDRIEIKYMPVTDAVLWDRNPKQHDIGALVESIKRHGFVDPPKLDATLGAFVYGNGRTTALALMMQEGGDPPRGIGLDKDGAWLMPVKVGVDADSVAAAESLAVDHNNLTLSGSDFMPWDVARLWDGDAYIDLLQSLAEDDELPVTVDGDDLDALLRELEAPEFKEYDESIADDVEFIECPSCGHSFPK